MVFLTHVWHVGIDCTLSSVRWELFFFLTVSTTHAFPVVETDTLKFFKKKVSRLQIAPLT